LTTSYKKQIVFQQEMSGTADIVTKDLRLLERLLYQFRDVFKRKLYKRQNLTSPDSNENKKCFPCWKAFFIVMDSGNRDC